MGPAYGPMSQRLSRFRMPGQRMPAINPDPNDEQGMDMPPGQGDLGEELMSGEAAPQDPRMIGGPQMGPMGARIMQVHTAPEAQAARGYAMPIDKFKQFPSVKDPAAHAADTSRAHAEQHNSIARAIQTKKALLGQKVQARMQILSDLIKSGKAGQNLDRVQAEYSGLQQMYKDLMAGSAVPGITGE